MAEKGGCVYQTQSSRVGGLYVWSNMCIVFAWVLPWKGSF